MEAGFSLNESVVLTARAIQPPPKCNPEVTMRPLVEEWEWSSALQNQLDCREPPYSREGYTPFKTRQMERYLAMVRAGLGAWFGAFLDGRVVADLGVFVEDGLGRFQSVGTHPHFRRRGICGTLVFEAARYAFTHLGAQTLVMVADENYHAAKIYESVGFQPAERFVNAEWWER